MVIRSHTVKIVRNFNKENEEVWENIQCNIQPKKGFFEVHEDIRKGDYIFVPNRREPYVVIDVETYDSSLTRDLNHLEVYYLPESEFIEKQQQKIQQTVSQQFYGDVKNVAGRDININNIDVTVLLHAIVEDVKNNKEIPEENKKSILKSLNDLIHDPYVVTLGTKALTELIKQLLTSSP